MRSLLDPRRLARLLVGLLLYALSMATIIEAGLGNMPWDVLTQGLVRRTGLSFGALTALVGLAVLACWIPLRQRPGIGTVLNVVVISAAIDPALVLVRLLPDPLPLAARVGLLLAGVALNALATSLYVGARLGPGPRDGLMTGLVARTGWPLRLVRTGIEVTVVAAGFALGGRLGLGTVVYALAVGPLVHAWLPRLTWRERAVEPSATDPDGLRTGTARG